MAGDHRHDFEKERCASEAGRADPQHSRRWRLLEAAEGPHGLRLAPAAAFGPDK